MPEPNLGNVQLTYKGQERLDKLDRYRYPRSREEIVLEIVEDPETNTGDQGLVELREAGLDSKNLKLVLNSLIRKGQIVLGSTSILEDISELSNSKLRYILLNYYRLTKRDPLGLRNLDSLHEDLLFTLKNPLREFGQEGIYGYQEESPEQLKNIREAIYSLERAKTDSDKIISIDKAINLLHTDYAILPRLYGMGPKDGVNWYRILNRISNE